MRDFEQIGNFFRFFGLAVAIVSGMSSCGDAGTVYLSITSINISSMELV
ncbi:MAG TPA: hypothetical protein VK184_25945 [Nostocaceae cyanobacterium]|nr:hypothetical protein [Nostocaceae cyanobacterium]